MRDGTELATEAEQREESGPTPAQRRRRRMGLVVGGLVLLILAAVILDRLLVVRPGAAQMVVLTNSGEVTRVIAPGQTGYVNPWTDSRVVYDMALIAADRAAPPRGMGAVSAEGHSLTVFGTAYWREGREDDIRWRVAHIRNQGETVATLMAGAVQAVVGRYAMDDLIHRMPEVQTALTEALRARARELLRVDVAEFVVTGIEPGESYRQVVAERELGRARAASVSASPALSAMNPYALEVERIRRWDGRGIIPEFGRRGGPGGEEDREPGRR
ncbi:SPFH domain-containing protein [Muricoccus radiodurans]|uniref:SPFH domain-containing protein n=1 Tax=Muricoccus radiodurans TaxID=2231721 RepID=UPI003CE8061B